MSSAPEMSSKLSGEITRYVFARLQPDQAAGKRVLVEEKHGPFVCNAAISRIRKGLVFWYGENFIYWGREKRIQEERGRT